MSLDTDDPDNREPSRNAPGRHPNDLALVLTGLENEVTSLVDVTIAYPNGPPTFWEFVKRECSRIEVLVQCRELPDSVRSAAGVDEKRHAIEPWIEDIWLEKDNRLADCGQTPEVGTAT